MADKRELAKIASLGHAAVSRRGLLGWTSAGALGLSLGRGKLLAAAPAGRRSFASRAQGGDSAILIGTLGDADTLNPFHSGDNSESEWRAKMLFDEFVRPDPQSYAATPGVAAAWAIDGLSFTFTIQPSIQFIDGSELTAEDVRFTLEGILNPATASNTSVKLTSVAGAAEYAAGTATSVSGIEVLDPKTIKITLAKPDAAFLYNMRYIHIVPKAVLEGKDLSKASADDFFTKTPIGAGPYIFESWSVGADWIANANPTFWEAGKPTIQRLTHRTIPDSAALVNALQAGDIDGSLYPAPTLAAELESNPELTILVPPFNAPNGSFFNCRNAPLNDARVRRGLAMATNVDEYVSTSLLGLGAAGLGPIAPDSWAHDPTLEPIPYDPAGARALLEEAGAVGAELSMHANAGNVLREDWLIRCQADWAEVGITLNVEFIEWATLVERITVNQDFEIIGADFAGVTAEPSELYEQFHSTSSQNYSGYSTPEMDALLEQAKQTLDQEAAKPIYAEIQRLYMQDVPMHSAWYRPFLHVVRSDYTGYTGSNLDGGLFRSLAEMSGPSA